MADKHIDIRERTVDFETNLEVNVDRKKAKYRSLMESLKSEYTEVMFFNLSISSLGIFGLSCSSFTDVCDALAVSMIDTGAI